MKRNIFVLAAFAASVLLMGCSGSTGSSDGVTLKFNMAKGSKLDYNANLDMTIKETVMGTDMNITSKITLGYLFEVTGDSAGWKNLTSTITRIGMDMNAGGMAIKFDSDNPNTDTAGPTGMVAKIFGGMKGGQFSFTMNEKGEVGEVHGLKEMMMRVMSNANIGDGEMMMQSMGKAFDEDNFKQNIQQSFAVYPDKSVKPGDTWVKTLNLNNNGLAMKAENTYTLESVTGDNAKIKVTSKLTSGGDSTAIAGMQVDMSGTMTGDMNYDIPSGAPLGGNLDMKMKMNMKGQGQEIPMDMDMKMTITGKKM